MTTPLVPRWWQSRLSVHTIYLEEADSSQDIHSVQFSDCSDLILPISITSLSSQCFHCSQGSGGWWVHHGTATLCISSNYYSFSRLDIGDSIREYMLAMNALIPVSIYVLIEVQWAQKIASPKHTQVVTNIHQVSIHTIDQHHHIFWESIITNVIIIPWDLQEFL